MTCGEVDVMFGGMTSRSRTWTYIAVVLSTLFVLHYTYTNHALSAWQAPLITPGVDPAATGPGELDTSLATAILDENPPPCRKLPGGEDVVVIMRTGATEIQDKLPKHFETTFRCYSDLIIFSDYEETFFGHQVHDVLRSVTADVKEENDDFEIYRRMLKSGRKALHTDELSGKQSFEGSKSGKLKSAGWKLDKWKFLPMMTETLKLRPNKKWYLFLESDSYVVWSNLLKYVSNLDPYEDIYFGSENQIGDDIFAHGGSAFLMSSSAIRKGSRIYHAKQDEWHDWTNRHWAGDCVLGRALKEAGVNLGWAWPMFQGGHPEKMDFAESKGRFKRVWCSAAISYHHFADVELQRMWRYEQQWIADGHRNFNGSVRPSWLEPSAHRDPTILYHQDVFQDFVYPNLTRHKDQWNNLGSDLIPDTAGQSLEECRRACDDDAECLQFSHGPDGCAQSRYAMLGQRWGDMQSEWDMSRISGWIAQMDTCDYHDDWTLI